MDLTLQLNQMKFLKGNDFRKDIIDNGHLGQGNNRVYNVIMKGKNYALKQVVINSCNIDNEIKIMQSLSKSQYVINLIDYMILEISDNYQQSQQFAYLLMERGQQNLDQFIKDQKQYLENEDLHKILEQLINIFEHLQLQNIAHRDIKLENILLMELNQLKACDVGCSSQIDQIQTINVVGTQSYLAPELLNAETTKFKHNPFKSDVYSLGLCFLYLVTLQLWNQRQKCNIQIEAEIINDYIRHVKRITGNDEIIMKLLKHMLKSNPIDRPDFKELKILYIQTKEQQEHQLSKRTTLESFESPKKSIQQYDYLSPDIITNRGRNTGSNFYQDRQKSAKNLQNNNLSQTKKQQSQTNLLSDGNRKRQTSKSPKHSSPSQQIQFSSSFQKPPSANPLKLVQTNKQRSYKTQATPSSPLNQQSNTGQIRQQSKFYQSVVETKKSNLSFSQTQTLPQIQTLPPNEIKFNQDLLLCTYDELSTLYQFQNCVSLQLKNNSIQRKCQLPNDCTILNLKLNNSTPELQLETNNRIQTLILELVEDYNTNNNYKWADNLGSMLFPAIDQVEIIQLCKQSQANNIINYLTKIQHIPKICITIKVEIPDQDHRTIMWKLSKYNCSKFEFRIPNIKLKYPVAQLWSFNRQLDELVLDYEDGGLDSAFSLLAASIRTLVLKKFHFNFSKLQSKNSEISLLFEYLGTNYTDTLKDLALSMDYLSNYDKLVQEKLKNNLTKLKNLEKLYLSLVGNGINYEFIERLFNVFDQLNQLKLIILIVDRQFEKQKIRELKKIFPFLNSFTIQFYGTYTNLTIIMHNNEFDKILNYGINKCNQGKQIKLGQMYYCIKCSKTHSFFLKHMFQICSSCVVSCHSKCDTPSSDQITIGSDSLVQSQIFTFMLKKNHTCIQSFNSSDYKCYCYLLGNCTYTVQNRDRNKHQIQFKCSTCKKNLCRQCQQECHSTHSLIETYITKFKCECECDKHV